MWQRSTSNRTHTRSRRKCAPEKVSNRSRTLNELVLSEYDPHTTIIKDHEGSDAILAWCSKFYDEDPVEKVPPFPFQVYLTNHAKEIIKDIKGFAERFVSFIEFIGGIPHHSGHCAEDRCSQRQCRHEAGFHEDEYGSRNFKDYASFCHYRFEVYSKPLTNVLACVAHQRREVQYRNRNRTWPNMVSTWTTLDSGYKGRIIVIDRDDWTEAGLVLVGFDPAQYERGHSYTFWNVAQKGDHPVIEAGRIGAKSILRERLRAWWVNAGHSWTEAHLDRRNKGVVSPVLYPAIDPAARHDADFEYIYELDDTSLPGTIPTVQRSTVHPQTGDPLIQDSFDKAELFLTDEDFSQLRSESYSDIFGLPVTSVWNTKMSSLRPAFSMTIYMTFDTVLNSKALFNCLNKGLVENEAWTLDIVRNMPSLEASFDYHTRASSSRTSKRLADRSRCVRMTLDKIAGHRLPVELLDYIRELIVPPEIPNYSSRPTRLFKDVFLFLDSSSLSMGPQLIYSNPASFWADTESSKGAFSDPGRWSSAFMREYASQDPILQVVNLRFWHRVADEIHILWSFCSARLTSIDATNMPRISIYMELPEEIYRGQFRDALTDSEPRYELDYSQPITVPNQSLSHLDFFDIIDLDSGTALPRLPFSFRRLGINSCYDTWAQSRSEELGIEYMCLQLRTLCATDVQGRKRQYPINRGAQTWKEAYLHAEDLLTEGHWYSLRLREGVQIPRWILGTKEGGGHPYNLPPIEVTMSDSARVTFRYMSRP